MDEVTSFVRLQDGPQTLMEVLAPAKTVDVELRDRLSEVESAIIDLTTEKDMAVAQLHVAELERRKLHRLVAVLDRIDDARET